MFIKVKPVRLGDHFHVSVFVAPNKHVTMQNAGELVFDPEQWDSFRLILIRGQSAADLAIEVTSHDR